MKKYVINLKRRTDRLEQFKINYPYKELEIIEAFDGKYLDKNEKNKDLYYKIINHKNSYDITNSELGCMVSHMSVWKKIIDSNTKYNLIFEDDAIFSDNFKTELDKIELDKYIDNILYVGGRHKPDFIMDKEFSIDVTDKLVKHNLDIEFNWNQQFRGAFGYLITKQFANILYYSFDFIYDGQALDHYIFNCLKHYKLDIINTKPLLCYGIINADDSDIRYVNGNRK
jgi:glycosyl transferase family 25